MTARIELINLHADPSFTRGWDHGPQRTVPADPSSLAAALGALAPDVDAVLCLDGSLPLPPHAVLDRLLAGPADAWHADLHPGTPSVLDHVDPLWMLNTEADRGTEHSSWRTSLRTLLVRTAVLDQLGGPGPGFDTLEGAGLDLGLRWIRSGAIVRCAPGLLNPASIEPVRGRGNDPTPSAKDRSTIVGRHYGRRWAGWALCREAMQREVGFRDAIGLARRLGAVVRSPVSAYRPPSGNRGATDRTVSVIVPTIDRYAYLVPLLRQLASQTVAPHEVIIADQTPLERRRHDLAELEPNLAITVIDLPHPGQCTARNAAIREATGELLLFIDDDDEIEATLISDYLERLVDGVDAICGGVDDADAGPPPEGFTHRRVSSTFPTNNTMLRRSSLRPTGLFDPAYDRGSRADHDLGMRLQRTGALMVYDPTVLVFHHHAPAGGLRTHGARTVTRSRARRSVLVRDLPSVTELYLGLRYYSASQVREGALIRLFSLLSAEGSRARRSLRIVVQLALLPSSIRRISATRRQAEGLLANRPAIPDVEEAPSTTDASYSDAKARHG